MIPGDLWQARIAKFAAAMIEYQPRVAREPSPVPRIYLLRRPTLRIDFQLRVACGHLARTRSH